MAVSALACVAAWHVENASLVEFDCTPERYEPTVHSLASFFTL